ncbi:MAG TPA: VWA domain-containing protein, partial [Edaphobacter sp.]
MMTHRSRRFSTSRTPAPALFLVLLAFLIALPVADAQTAPASQPPAQQQKPDQAPEAGPESDSGTIVLKKKKEADEPPAPAAPAEPKVKNPNNETYSLRVDVPIVNLDVNVILDKTHQFVPG